MEEYLGYSIYTKKMRFKMNKIVLVLALGLFSTASFSQVRRWFHTPMNCYISGSVARCQATNYRFRPIYCEAQASAVTSFGYRLNGFFRGWVQPRQSAFVFIRANNPYRDPIVQARANARCLF